MKFSIVTPSFNQHDFLGLTLQSVLNQRGNFELAVRVVDGGSTDGSVQLLQTVTDPRLRFTSEIDRGQSHAINTGLADADGDVVAWLNSDDLYTPGALQRVADAFENPATQWVVGRCENIDENGNVVRSKVADYKNRSLGRYSRRRLLRENFVAQPAVFWRRSLGSRVGPLDESLNYTMDYDLWLRLSAAANPVVINVVLAQFRIHPGSKSGAVRREQFDEGYRVACRYAAHDRASRLVHRFNVEKIVWAYRVMRLLGL